MKINADTPILHDGLTTNHQPTNPQKRKRVFILCETEEEKTSPPPWWITIIQIITFNSRVFEIGETKIIDHQHNHLQLHSSSITHTNRILATRGMREHYRTSQLHRRNCKTFNVTIYLRHSETDRTMTTGRRQTKGSQKDMCNQQQPIQHMI